jgi:16S rRNA (cytosine967-C5)-methyltransferase
VPASPSRVAAYEILLRVERNSAFADQLLHSVSLNDLSPADRALCTEIVMGVLRWQLRLDFTLQALTQRSIEKLDIEVLIALRIGLYQIGWLQRVPQRAAVNESAELVKRARKRSAVAFVNAVLRKASTGLPETPVTTTPADLAVELSHPQWLVSRWTGEFSFDTTRKICEFDQRVPDTTIRIADDDAERELIQAGVKLSAGRIVYRARIVEAGDVTRTRAFLDGRIHFQDEGSQLVALLVGRGRRLLDCCAAPGGKTIVLAEQNPQSTITAADLHEHRARTLRQRVRAANVEVVTADARNLPQGGYDRVLADVPCSGTGTLARNPEVKWKLRESDLADLHQRQVEILRAALGQLEPGGRAVYSTCSLEREECEDVVEQVLADSKGIHLVPVEEALPVLYAAGEVISRAESLTRGPYLRTIPGLHPCDGFFAAVIERA